MDPEDPDSDLDPEHCCKASLKQRASRLMYGTSLCGGGEGEGRRLKVSDCCYDDEEDQIDGAVD